MRILLVIVEILWAFYASAQEPEQMERQQESTERTLEQEPLLQEDRWRRRHPLCINTASAEALRTLPGVTEPQVQSLLAWRSAMGPLLVVEELGAVPYWDAGLVRRLQPLLTTVPDPWTEGRGLTRGGEHSLVFRAASELRPGGPYREGQYAGGPERLYLRYRYRNGDRLRWGLSFEKDPGETLRAGPDFSSAHLFWQGKGLLRTVALGDFTVNMGQGLIQWDAPAFGGAADLGALKRQGPFLQPFLSADEYHFARGAGVTLQQGAWQLSAYISGRRLSARATADSLGSMGSIDRSGYHRTASERRSKGAVGASAAGGRLQWERGAVRIGLQGRTIRLSAPLVPEGKPYAYFAASGTRLRHASLDWGLTKGPVHFFGEAALDGQGHMAFIQGLLLSGAAAWDAALQYRHLPPAYAAFDGNAVTRRSAPQNEEGVYLALQVRPAKAWQLAAWADLFRYPWLRYGVDAPGGGLESGLRAGWRPGRHTEVGLRYRFRDEPRTRAAGSVLPEPASARQRSLRLQVQQEGAGGWRGSVQAEGLWMEEGEEAETGFAQTIALHAPSWKGLRAALQATAFATDSYASRIYVYQEAAGGGSVGMLYGNGERYSIIIQYDRLKRVLVSVQAIRTRLFPRAAAPLPPDPGKTEVRMQVSCYL